MKETNLAILERCAKELEELKVSNWGNSSDKELDRIRNIKKNVATLLNLIVIEERNKI